MALLAHLARTAPALAVVETWRRRKSYARCDEHRDPVVVLGGGVMGLSTAWSLSRSGVKVTLVDAGHSEKGSWGETRIARVSYVDPVLLRLARRSYELYAELAEISGETLMHRTGCLDVGFQRGSLDRLAKTYEDLGQSYQRLTHREVAQRWPTLQLTKDYVEASVFCSAGDAVLASVVLEVLKDQLLSSPMVGYLEGEAVISIDRKKKTLSLADGRSIRYSKLVLAAGIWTNSVLRAADLPLLPLVTSIEQQTYYAAPEGKEDFYSAEKLPVIIEHNPPPEPQMKRRGGYMIPHVPQGVDGVKFGMHRQGPLMDHEDFPMPVGSKSAVEKIFSAAGTRKEELWLTRWPEEEDVHLRKETDAFGKRILPSLRLERSELTMRCPYDQHLYADEDFVVGVHPKDPNVVVVCGFAGEGFKFGPAIGEMAKCLVTGSSFSVPESFQRFRLERPSHVESSG